jgi:hypothetical protein
LLCSGGKPVQKQNILIPLFLMSIVWDKSFLMMAQNPESIKENFD